MTAETDFELFRRNGHLLLIASNALTQAPLGSRPYHVIGARIHDGWVLTACGCWGYPANQRVRDDAMVMVAPKVARLIGRPCKDCLRLLERIEGFERDARRSRDAVALT